MLDEDIKKNPFAYLFFPSLIIVFFPIFDPNITPFKIWIGTLSIAALLSFIEYSWAHNISTLFVLMTPMVIVCGMTSSMFIPCIALAGIGYMVSKESDREGT